MSETPHSRWPAARRRLTRLALLVAVGASGAGGGVLHGLGAAPAPVLLSYLLGAAGFGLLVGLGPRWMRRPPLALSLVALLLGGLAAIYGSRTTGALGVLGVFAAGSVAGGVQSSTLAGLRSDGRTASAASVGAAWSLAVFAGVAAGHSLDAALGAIVAAALSAAGDGLLRVTRHPGPDRGEPTGPDPRPPQALDPHVLLGLTGAGFGLALAGLAAPTAAGSAVTAAGLSGAAGLGALIGVAVGEMLRRWAGVARLAAPFGCAALGFILLQGALSARFALAAAALIGAGLGGLPAPLLAWRQTTSPTRAGFAVAALALGQAAGVLVWIGLSASPLPYGAGFVVMATMMGIAAFASAGLGGGLSGE